MIYKRQFVILRQNANLPDFHQINLWNHYILQYHPSLPVFCLPEKKILLLGIAWQVSSNKKSPQEELSCFVSDSDSEKSLKAIIQMEETWCGRYILIFDRYVLTDATGKMAVYYSPEGVSNNLSLLASVCGLNQTIYTPQSTSLNWMPGPRTQYPSISQCLPSQILDFTVGQVQSRNLLADIDLSEVDNNSLYEKVISCFDTSFQNMNNTLSEYTIMEALTGGYDSRASLGLLKHSGITFRTFTLGHDHLSPADKLLPPVLSERSGVAYTYVPKDPSAYSKELEDTYIAFTSGLIRDADRLFFAHGQYQELIKQHGKCAFLRSAIWGTLAERYAAAFDSDGPNDVFYEWFGVRDGTLEKESLEEYLAWVKEHPQKNLSPADSFFWDQREGCWMGAIENGFDLMDDCISLHPANCRYILTLLNHFPREERITKSYEANIASYAFPDIKDIPYTVRGKVNQLTRIMNKCKKGLDRLSKFGIRNTIKTYMHILKKNNDVKKNRKK